MQLTAALVIKFNQETSIKVASSKLKIKVRPTTRSQNFPIKQDYRKIERTF